MYNSFTSLRISYVWSGLNTLPPPIILDVF